MIIYHHTTMRNAAAIQSSGFIDLEGCNAKHGRDLQNRKERRLVFNTLGRFVWFTTQQKCKTATANEVSFPIVAESIGAIQWNEYKKRFKNSKKKWEMVEAMDEQARRQGDNVADYWISTKPVKLFTE